MAETALIRLTSLPVIEEQLRTLKEIWEQKAKDAESMVCTEDTVQDIKKARAEMRKEHDAAETQRKAVKAQYMAPWARVEAIYKECVEDAYNRADAAYKAKVAEVEDIQKAECEKNCRDYFAELCAVHGVEWLRYEQAGLKISLTEAKKKMPSGLFDKLSEFVARVACDVDTISAMEDGPDVLAEYKSNGLSMAKAVKTVWDRREAQEAERKAAEERAERQKREAEAVARVEAAVHEPPIAIAPPEIREYAKYLLSKEQGPPKETEKIYGTDYLGYHIRGTMKQLQGVKEHLKKALVDYLKQEGIQYE